ncbi:MAG TPA: SGNH/GDSL hydrolase family protein [Terriglobales bacterium]|nr:SGNH/GDSL hydrolase family protein [Terriglobales bacterium]
MRIRSQILLFALISTALAIGLLSAQRVKDDSPKRWITTWATANAASDLPASFSNQTIREIIHTTIGGSGVRLRLSNTFGTRAIRFDAVFIGRQATGVEGGGASLVPSSNRQVMFGGNPFISIPEGAEVLSDPIALSVAPQKNLTISLFISEDSGPATVHGSAFQTNYVSGPGNFAADESGKAFADGTGSKAIGSWYFLRAVEVLAPANVKGAVVVLGDSITDGASTHPDKNERWTDVLARRILASHMELAVLNAGIGGNRVLTSSPCWGQNALARLGRDVLAETGIKAVILFEGTNDIGQPDSPAANTNSCFSRTQVTADEIIAGYQQIIARTHARSLKIFGATILPYQGLAAWTPSGEAKRVAVNQWIRNSGAFDGVIDFDAALRDPAKPSYLAPQYDSGDHLHPGAVGHEAMGNAVDMRLFR